MEKRLVDRTQDSADDVSLESSLRPQMLDDYVGQEQTKEGVSKPHSGGHQPTGPFPGLVGQ